MQRRKFFAWLGLGWFVSVLPQALTFLGQKTALAATQKIRTDGFTSVGTLADLDKNGFLKGEIDKKAFIVVRDPLKKNALSAVTSICTHRQCKVDWKAAEKRMVCPCHNAQFSADGKVLNGPAKTPLQAYVAKTEGSSVLVKLS